MFEDAIQIRAPAKKGGKDYREDIKKGLNGKTLILDFFNKTPNLAGNCLEDGYMYVNTAAPESLYSLLVSHELMHEAGLFTDSGKDEAALQILDYKILAGHSELQTAIDSLSVELVNVVRPDRIDIVNSLVALLLLPAISIVVPL